MDQSEQEREHIEHMLLSGKFLVAGELLRQRIAAAITCEIANKCDVIARNGRTIIPIQVKTTRDSKWSVGNNPAEPDDSIWVFVHLPRDSSAPSEFFVLTGAELHAILKPKHDALLEKEKASKRPRTPGRFSDLYISSDDIETHKSARDTHKSAWDKVRRALGRTS